MPNKPSADKAPVYARVPRGTLAAAAERAQRDETTITAVITHALGEYAAGRFVLPSGPQSGQSTTERAIRREITAPPAAASR